MFSVRTSKIAFFHYYSYKIYNLVQEELLNVPCTSPVDDLTITYFNSVIAERLRIAKETHREAKRILDTASNFLK